MEFARVVVSLQKRVKKSNAWLMGASTLRRFIPLRVLFPRTQVYLTLAGYLSHHVTAYQSFGQHPVEYRVVL
jgi:hypothetical protein